MLLAESIANACLLSQKFSQKVLFVFKAISNNQLFTLEMRQIEIAAIARMLNAS